ncbi:MAG: hypothetical protein GXP09_11460 [Gammaproteobacteria bacterium]|nr:hypothetical protein [Gammaproteobacteria bacterium]
MGRGMERRRVFQSDVDKKDFLDRLGEGLEQAQCQCYAWALMSNHYHLKPANEVKYIANNMVLNGRNFQVGNFLRH